MRSPMEYRGASREQQERIVNADAEALVRSAPRAKRGYGPSRFLRQLAALRAGARSYPAPDELFLSNDAALNAFRRGR